MNHSCRLPVRGAMAIAMALTPWLSGCGYARDESGGPSFNFRVLDVNRDGAVDRFEWENVQGADFPGSASFRYADCDADGRMTRHEYSLGYMGVQHCPGTYLYETVAAESAAPPTDAVAQVDDTLGEDWESGPLVVRAEEQVQIYAMPPAEIDVPTHMRRRLPPRPGRYSEADLSPAALQRVRFSSEPVQDTLLVAHYDPREKIPGNEARMVFPLMVCEVGNANPDVRITMVDLQIAWRLRGKEYHSRLLKTLWADPATTQAFHVWFGSPVDAAECRLLHARGQPAG